MVSGEQVRRRAFPPTMAGMIAVRVCALFSRFEANPLKTRFSQGHFASYSRASWTLFQQLRRKKDIVPGIALEKGRCAKKRVSKVVGVPEAARGLPQGLRLRRWVFDIASDTVRRSDARHPLPAGRVSVHSYTRQAGSPGLSGWAKETWGGDDGRREPSASGQRPARDEKKGKSCREITR